MTPARIIKTTMIPMAITPDVFPMEAGSTVAVASIDICIGTGVVSKAVVVVFLDGYTISAWFVLSDTNPIIKIKKTKILMCNFIIS